jgi:hypothetical protein
MAESLKNYNHVDLLFPSQWLKSADFRGKTVTVVIDKIDPRHELKRQDGSAEKKPVMYLRGSWKPMVLNKTNGKIIAKLYGPEVTEWVGKPIQLRAEKVSSFGATVDAIRVVPSKPPQRGAASEPEPEKESREPTIDETTGEVIDDGQPSEADQAVPY